MYILCVRCSILTIPCTSYVRCTCTMCTMYIVLCTMYIVHMDIVRCTQGNIIVALHRTSYIVQGTSTRQTQATIYTMYKVHSTSYDVHSTSVQGSSTSYTGTMYIGTQYKVLCTMYYVHSICVHRTRTMYTEQLTTCIVQVTTTSLCTSTPIALQIRTAWCHYIITPTGMLYPMYDSLHLRCRVRRTPQWPLLVRVGTSYMYAQGRYLQVYTSTRQQQHYIVLCTMYIVHRCTMYVCAVRNTCEERKGERAGESARAGEIERERDARREHKREHEKKARWHNLERRSHTYIYIYTGIQYLYIVHRTCVVRCTQYIHIVHRTQCIV